MQASNLLLSGIKSHISCTLVFNTITSPLAATLSRHRNVSPHVSYLAVSSQLDTCYAERYCTSIVCHAPAQSNTECKSNAAATANHLKSHAYKTYHLIAVGSCTAVIEHTYQLTDDVFHLCLQLLSHTDSQFPLKTVCINDP
jgi:hypothetical protein